MYPPAEHVLRDLLVDYEWTEPSVLTAEAPMQQASCARDGAMDTGAMFAIADLLACQVAMPTVDGDWVGTRDLSLISSARCVDGPLRLSARVLSAGRRLMTTAVELEDGNGRSVARVTATVRRMRRESTEVADTSYAADVGVRHSMALEGSGFDAPLHRAVGIEVLEPGRLRLDKSDYVRNSFGTVNGGAMAILGAAAAESAAGAGALVADLTVRYVGRAGDGAVIAGGRVLRETATGSTVEVDVRNESGDGGPVAIIHAHLTR